MTNMRAKVKVSNINQFEGSESLTFNAVCANKFGDNGSDENNTYAKYTPSAEFKLTVNNPALLGKFKVGAEYYVDFSPVEKKAD